MKKLLSILALALCFVACQNEAVESVNNGDLANVVLTIDAPELGVTRADGDANAAKNSAFGAIDFLTDADWANYDLRYILEVYAENENGTGEPIYRERLVNCLDKYAPTTFELRLVPERTYKFVVFADFVAEGNAELTEPAAKLAIRDLYYNTADLRNITSITDELTWGAMNEIRDAYFVTENVQITNGLNKTLTLTRPFAKLRVIATDLDYIAGYSKPGYVEVAYHTEKIYKSFNAVNGELNTTEMAGDELKYGYEVSKTIPYTAGYDEFSTNQTLFTDYLLAVEGEQTTVNFTIAVYEDATKTRKIHEHDFNTQIPIQRNHLTTIIGDLLTTQANITIEIDDNFVDEFVVGWGDDNSTKINVWNAGELNANGDYTFVVNGENNFKVTVNGAAVKNQKLTAGDYVLAEDAEEGAELTFTVEELKANETTRALTAVEVIGGTMKVESIDDNYKITLDLVLEFSENKDVRHAIYTYEGPITFGKVLETPKVEAAVEGNVITLTWNAVADATSYTITGVAENPVVTEETSYVFTGEYETEYTFTVVASNDTLYSQPYTIVATTKAAPVVEEGYKLYFNNLANWTKVYAHIWANEGEDLGLESVEWPGRELTETEELDDVTYYVFQLPAEATGKTLNVVFNNGAGTQTNNLAGVVEGNLFFDNYVEPVEPTDVKLYLNTGSDWYNDNGGNVWFAAYFFGNAGNTWTKMTAVEGEDYLFETTIPEGDYTSVIFTMMYGDKDALDWGSKKNQTVDIVLPTDGSNCYTIENPWDESNGWKAWGSWSVYAPTVEPEEPTALATPVVTYEINEGKLTLSWEAIDGAKDYTAKYGENSLVVEGTTAIFDAVVGTYTASVVANPADETKNTASEAGTVEVTVEQTTLTIAEVLKVAEDTAVNTAGQVMAVYQKGFIMSDNTGTIVVYTNSAPSVKVGNNIAVSGTFDNYFGTLQIASPTITENDDATTAPVYPTPIDLTDQTAYDAYETFGTDHPTTFPYVKIKGTLSNDRYITVGTSTKQSMFNFSNSDYSAMNGKTITTVAYIMGYHSTNGYYQLVETSVEAEPYISAPENVNVAADATSATINVSANVAWDVTCDANWVTFEKTATSISVTFEANNGDERTATFILSGEGVDAVIVTLTQGAKLAEGVVTESVTLKMADYFSAAENIVNTDGTAKSYEFGEYTFSFSKVNNNISNYNATDQGIRFYQSDVMKIDAGSKTMVKIEFETYGGKTGPFTSNVGSVEGTTWTGSASSVELTASAQVRFKSVTITYLN